MSPGGMSLGSEGGVALAAPDIARPTPRSRNVSMGDSTTCPSQYAARSSAAATQRGDVSMMAKGIGEWESDEKKQQYAEAVAEIQAKGYTKDRAEDILEQ